MYTIDMQDRRKEQRKNLMAYTQVFNLYGGYLLGYLADLHLQGAMVIGNKAIPNDIFCIIQTLQ